MRLAATEKMLLVEAEPLDGPLQLDVTAEFKVAKSYSNKKRTDALNGQLLPTKTPDLSNILKMAEDCLSGVVFNDDAQVCEIHCNKRYGAQPKIIVTVTQL